MAENDTKVPANVQDKPEAQHKKTSVKYSSSTMGPYNVCRHSLAYLRTLWLEGEGDFLVRVTYLHRDEAVRGSWE